ncbi:hypothetical protein [uncultured Duncaniella sp.]|uniref:hypothetical protein n=1 Tax=uncultured Duncaniella sp. TaxID=2768039 RepID=UPI0026F3CB88|nr:hypothetical protein [uncultured Duncaniella sp.]
MTVQAEEMCRAVKVAIDMNRGDEPLIMEGDTDTLTLDEIIYAKLADAVRAVEMEAPLTMLESGHDFGDDNVFIGEDGKGFIILPNDFMRLISFRMSDWQRTIYEAISESDPQYALQSSRFKGICGNPEKPVVAVVRRSEGKVLEFYSCKSDTATVAQATYLPIPKIDRDGGIDVAEDCYRAAVYRAASLALASVGDQLSTSMLEISKSLLQ